MRTSTITRLAVALGLTMAMAVPAMAQPAMTAQEQANLQHVLDWWRECIQGRHLELTSKYQDDNYIQHNINVPTGRQGFVS